MAIPNIDDIGVMANDAAAQINNVLMLGTSAADHRKIRMIIAKTIARAVAQTREATEPSA